MPVRHFYLLSHYIYYGLFFLFSVFWLHVNEFNSFWERLRGRGQKVVAYSDIVSAMLSRCHRQRSLYTINIKAISLIFISDEDWLPPHWYSLRQGAHLPSKREPFWPLPLIPPKDYCIHSFWSQNTEKRNNTISQMRLRSVFKMRTSILNTATTEQMGYGIISFFVCFL